MRGASYEAGGAVSRARRTRWPRQICLTAAGCVGPWTQENLAVEQSCNVGAASFHPLQSRAPPCAPGALTRLDLRRRPCGHGWLEYLVGDDRAIQLTAAKHWRTSAPAIPKNALRKHGFAHGGTQNESQQGRVRSRGRLDSLPVSPAELPLIDGRVSLADGGNTFKAKASVYFTIFDVSSFSVLPFEPDCRGPGRFLLREPGWTPGAHCRHQLNDQAPGAGQPGRGHEARPHISRYGLTQVARPQRSFPLAPQQWF